MLTDSVLCNWTGGFLSIRSGLRSYEIFDVQAECEYRFYYFEQDISAQSSLAYICMDINDLLVKCGYENVRWTKTDHIFLLCFALQMFHG